MSTHVQLAPAPAETRPPPAVRRPIRVVLADNHTAMRRTLRLLLDSEEDLEVVAEAEDLSAVLRHVNHERPQVLVLDLGMYNGSSLEAIRRLRQQAPDSEIVVLTMEQSPGFARRAIDAGAVGFVLKDRADSELPNAVRSAARGEPYVSAYVSAGLDSLRHAADVDRGHQSTTEVLRLIALEHIRGLSSLLVRRWGLHGP